MTCISSIMRMEWTILVVLSSHSDGCQVRVLMGEGGISPHQWPRALDCWRRLPNTVTCFSSFSLNFSFFQGQSSLCLSAAPRALCTVMGLSLQHMSMLVCPQILRGLSLPRTESPQVLLILFLFFPHTRH